MEITIKWRQTHNEGKELQKPIWHILPLTDIENSSRDHAIALLSQKIQVVVKQNDSYISNDMELRNTFRKRGNRVYSFDQLQPSGDIIKNVGFM